MNKNPSYLSTPFKLAALALSLSVLGACSQNPVAPAAATPVASTSAPAPAPAPAPVATTAAPNQLPRVVVLATGGTIAGAGASAAISAVGMS